MEILNHDSLTSGEAPDRRTHDPQPTQRGSRTRYRGDAA
jgi:hypothetical protein